MKYLKLYESYPFEKLQEINKDIFYCFQDLTDANFEVRHLMGSNIIIEPIFRDRDYNEQGFYGKDVEETILFAISYLTSEHNIHLKNICIDYITFNNDVREHRQRNFTNLEDMCDWFDVFVKKYLFKINIYYTI